MFGATAGLCKTGQPELLLTETAASRKGQDLKGWDQWDLWRPRTPWATEMKGKTLLGKLLGLVGDVGLPKPNCLRLTPQ